MSVTITDRQLQVLEAVAVRQNHRDAWWTTQDVYDFKVENATTTYSIPFTFYPIEATRKVLERLLFKGLVSSRVRGKTGRREYKITAAGKKQIKKARGR